MRSITRVADLLARGFSQAECRDDRRETDCEGHYGQKKLPQCQPI